MRFAFALGFALLSVSPAFAVDPTGIPQCDALLKKYEACSSQLSPKQVHAAQKELLEGSAGIRANAGNAALRPDLERFCNDTFERMKKESDIKDCMASN
ncbi:hypothetical protein [Methylocystis heyeri]|uniref:3',5'-cyclic-nucleotide phosphodiesterase n=1 Tax=Methylocystis heyeri TaxID=391905 RepID=A0A6B8K9R3_9HYPH|nr:hypothetical protein [Methylocystis heyeri]QGM44846.1 hypothetical protein H2LOC_003610 [Methylocystis heyeri]